MKYCKDCKYFKKFKHNDYGNCEHPKNIKIDPVTNKKSYKESPNVMRIGTNYNKIVKFIIQNVFASSECGPDARWYEETPKENNVVNPSIMVVERDTIINTNMIEHGMLNDKDIVVDVNHEVDGNDLKITLNIIKNKHGNKNIKETVTFYNAII
jgi:hypothetical protein